MAQLSEQRTKHGLQQKPNGRGSGSRSRSGRAPSPPLPDVDWDTQSLVGSESSFAAGLASPGWPQPRTLTEAQPVGGEKGGTCMHLLQSLALTRSRLETMPALLPGSALAAYPPPAGTISSRESKAFSSRKSLKLQK